MELKDIVESAQRRLAGLKEYDGVLLFNGVICIGVCVALLLGEPVGAAVFGTLALLSFVARHRLRRFVRSLEHDLAGLAVPAAVSPNDCAARVQQRSRLTFWHIVVGR